MSALKKELAALASSVPVAPLKGKAKPRKVKEAKEVKSRNGGKFDEWNAFILHTQKDMARLAGLPPYDSYSSHAAFIKAAGEKGCGRIAAMKEASRRREEATGEVSVVKKRAQKAAVYIEEHPEMEEGDHLTYIQRLRNRLRGQEQEGADDVEAAPASSTAPPPAASSRAPMPASSTAPTPAASPEEDALKKAELGHPWKCVIVGDSPYFIKGEEAFYIEDDGKVGERAGAYDPILGEIDTSY